MVAYFMSIWRFPWSLAPHDIDKIMPYFGGMSATTMSMTRLSDGIYNRLKHRSLIRSRHLTLLESKEYNYLYGLVMSRPNLSITTFGMSLCEAPESSIALCRILAWMFKLT